LRFPQPSNRAADEGVNRAGHLGTIQTYLDRNVLILTIDLKDGGEAGVAGL
jgi:hypothetical protein